MRVLIYGLPGAGKTYLAKKLCEYLGDNIAWFNADIVREEANDWDFSDEGRQRQSERMLRLCKEAEAEGKVAVADFVAPFFQARLDFNADYEVFVDTIKEGRFEDTNKVFERSAVTMSWQNESRYHITEWNDIDAKNIAWIIGNKYIWNNQSPTTQMLGRFQPWHDGHQALLDRAMAKHGQVALLIRDMPTSESNPYTAQQVKDNLQEKLTKYAGRVKIIIVPNILNITYGRDVGYKIEKESFSKDVEDISAKKIRNAMKKDDG